ncbi:MAG: GNAT family N-acetyltransferase [Lachnospiraceae bacterium]|nr:GNAT family N-acetyltransferase [Lachnospiraceae bacterium]
MTEYRKATLDDLNILVNTRIEVLRAANQLEASVDMSLVEKESGAYYERALADGTHTAYLVFDNDTFIGAGGISYYSVMPTYHNPSGRKGYIMNMYVREVYRHRGIARHVLALLVEDARSRGVEHVSLEATAMGRPL